ncbi:LysM peptidoglycan-binding domain-containing protein [Lentisphaerota bacterium ZTH]|nr:LysM peptidoglycan-binding domain-containing protein [Lentisphaerota bacterium]WET06522.1 LysM peptidoglycan-binding domain-containing protein [Lentisphaerota bacterium ZTH]
MKFLTYLSLTAFIVIAGFGCSPKLAQSPLGPDEQNWEKFIKKYYPEWQAPQTVPPGPSGSDELQAPENRKSPVLAEDLNITDGSKVQSSPVALPEKPVVEAPEKKIQTYTVQKNDTLWKVSRKFYGKGSRWKEIQEANADVLKGKTSLRPGMTLKIPTP